MLRKGPCPGDSSGCHHASRQTQPLHSPPLSLPSRPPGPRTQHPQVRPDSYKSSLIVSLQICSVLYRAAHGALLTLQSAASPTHSWTAQVPANAGPALCRTPGTHPSDSLSSPGARPSPLQPGPSQLCSHEVAQADGSCLGGAGSGLGRGAVPNVW